MIKGECFSSLCHVTLWGFDDSVAGDNVSSGGGDGGRGVDGAYFLAPAFVPLPRFYLLGHHLHPLKFYFFTLYVTGGV